MVDTKQHDSCVCEDINYRNGSDPRRLELVSFLILLSTAVYYSLQLAFYSTPVSLLFHSSKAKLYYFAPVDLESGSVANSVSSYEIVRALIIILKFSVMSSQLAGSVVVACLWSYLDRA